MPNVPLPLLVPLGAILAACITGAISFVSLVISKEQKTSEFRQGWIDALRTELSEFSGQARRISLERVSFDLKSLTGTVLEQIEANNEDARRPDLFHENRLRMAQAYYALRLRLNPSESDHQALLNHLDTIYEILNTSIGGTYSETVAELDALARVAQIVLKREWTRVKEGEKGFRFAVGSAKWVAITFGISLVGYLAYAIGTVISTA